MKKEWHSHRRCVICGPQNPLGLKLDFRPHTEGGVLAQAYVHPRLEGYEGLLHGGVIASMLDSAMVNALYHELGIEAVTAEMTIRYRESIPLGSHIHIRAHIVQSRRTLHRTEAQIFHETRLMASAEARFITKI